MLDMPKATDAKLRDALGAGFAKHPLHKTSALVLWWRVVKPTAGV